jgi:hypothetical protein
MPAILESLALAIGGTVGGSLFRFYYLHPVIRITEDEEQTEDNDDGRL